MTDYHIYIPVGTEGQEVQLSVLDHPQVYLERIRGKLHWQIIERAAQHRIQIGALAEHARRSIGQMARFDHLARQLHSATPTGAKVVGTSTRRSASMQEHQTSESPEEQQAPPGGQKAPQQEPEPAPE